MIDVSALVGDIPTTAVVIETFGAPAVNSRGEAPAGIPTETAADLVVHPAEPEMLDRYGLDSSTAAIAVYGTAALVGPGGSTRPSVIQYDGRRWEVQRVEDYLALGGISFGVAVLV